MLVGGSGCIFRVLCWLPWLLCTVQVALCWVPSCILGDGCTPCYLFTCTAQVCQVPCMHLGANSCTSRPAACFMLLPLLKWQSTYAGDQALHALMAALPDLQRLMQPAASRQPCSLDWNGPPALCRGCRCGSQLTLSC